MSAVRIARLASLIIAMDDKKLEGLLRGAGDSDSAAAMFRRLADSFASEAKLLDNFASMMNDACGRLVVVMDRISVEEAARDSLSEYELDEAGDAAPDASTEAEENPIVVEIDRGLRSADLTPKDARTDGDGAAAASASADIERL